MTKIICSNCGRYYETELNVSSGSSHGYCARCNISLYAEVYDEEDLKQIIREEIGDNIIWLGEDNPKMKLKYFDKYNEILLLVKGPEGILDNR